jgi:hypothetical protein
LYLSEEGRRGSVLEGNRAADQAKSQLLRLFQWNGRKLRFVEYHSGNRVKWGFIEVSRLLDDFHLGDLREMAERIGLGKILAVPGQGG